MCKGPNDPGGPLRCASHAREALDAARRANDEASSAALENAGHIRAYPDALDDALGDAASASERRRRLQDEGAPAAEIEEANAEMLAHEQLATSLDREHKDRKANQPKLERRAAASAEHLQKKQAEYDATDAGLVDLQHELRSANDRMWNNYSQANAQERRDDEQRVEAIRARQAEAERRAWNAADSRQGSWDGNAEQQEHLHALADGHQEIAAAKELEARATTDEERASARIARESAEGFVGKLRERERAANGLRPKLSAPEGDLTDEESQRWGAVVSGHRRNLDVKTGQPTFEVTIDRRTSDGEQHRAKFEVPESEFTPELLDAYRNLHPAITRMPATSEVIRWAESRHGNVKGKTRKEFLASGGSASDWDSGQRAEKVLKQLSLA